MMNLREEILKEHSKKQALKIAAYISNHPQLFKELMDLFLHDVYRVNQRASWVVSICAEKHPELIKPYFNVMLENLKNPVHDAVKRNTIRIFEDLEIPEELMGELAEICFGYLTSDEPIAIKAFSLTVLSKIADKEPELQNELKIIIEDQMPYASAAFLSRAGKIMKKWEKKNK